MGCASVPPVFIVWGKQKEPLRRYGPNLIMIRDGLFEKNDEKLVSLVAHALSDDRIGADWEPDRTPPRYYEPNRKNV